MIKKGKICVLIDDDDDDQLIFSTTIKKHFSDYDFLSFSSFTEAEKTLEEKAEDIGVVFIDLNMPRINGKEGLVQLRNDPEYNSKPLIIYSTSNNPDDVKECLSKGATAFITKPSKINVLVSELSNYLALSN
jgi:CheY-like chemotaxis protein